MLDPGQGSLAALLGWRPGNQSGSSWNCFTKQRDKKKQKKKEFLILNDFPALRPWRVQSGRSGLARGSITPPSPRRGPDPRPPVAFQPAFSKEPPSVNL